MTETVEEPSAAFDRPLIVDAFDRLTSLATKLCDMPLAMILLGERQRLKCESQIGFGHSQVVGFVAFCLDAVAQQMSLRFWRSENIQVTDENPLSSHLGLQFVASVPLVDERGEELGMLCVCDRVSRTLDLNQRQVLETICAQAVTLLDNRLRLRKLERAKAADERTIAELRKSAARFRAFMDHSPAAAFLKDVDGRYVYVNAPCVRLFQQPAESWVGKTDFELWPEHAKAIRAKDRAVMSGSATAKFTERHPSPGNPDGFWQTYKFPFRDDDGEMFLAGIALDISKETAAQEALRLNEEKFRGVIQHLAESFFLVDLETKAVLDSNLAFRQLLGYDADEAGRLNLFDFVILDQKTVADEIKQVLTAGRFHLGYRRCRCKDGTLVDVDISVSVVSSALNTMLAVVLRDVSERCEYDRKMTEYQRELEGRNGTLQQLATTDGMTGLKNYAAFQERLSEEFERAKRYAVPLSLLLIDADHFKSYNDIYGHPAGDEALCRIARTLTRSARSTDFVARYGGEEFVVLMPQAGEAGAEALAERCRRAMAACTANRRVITLSVGVATVDAATPTAAEFLEQADRALYRAKHLGRNRVTHFRQIESKRN